MPPRVPSAIAESSGPVCGSSPPDGVLCEPPEDPPEVPPPPADLTSRVSDGFGLFAGVHVVVVPSALMVRTPAVKVTLPLFAGV